MCCLLTSISDLVSFKLALFSLYKFSSPPSRSFVRSLVPQPSPRCCRCSSIDAFATAFAIAAAAVKAVARARMHSLCTTTIASANCLLQPTVGARCAHKHCTSCASSSRVRSSRRCRRHRRPQPAGIPNERQL